MPRARIVRLKYKVPLSKVFRDLMRRKIVILSLSLLVLGIILISVSYHYPDVVHNPNRSVSYLSVTGDAVHTVKFNQPYNVSEAIYFGMPANQSVHYLLTSVTTTPPSPVSGISYTYYNEISRGNVSNGAVIHLNTMTSLQGQNYELNVSSVSSGQTVQVTVTTLYNITVKESTSKYIGGTGLLMIMGGAIIMAYAVTEAMEKRSKIQTDA